MSKKDDGLDKAAKKAKQLNWVLITVVIGLVVYLGYVIYFE